MDVNENYTISEKTRGKTGYLNLENKIILFKNPDTDEDEVRLARIEIFGRAMKTHVLDDNGNREFYIDSFSYRKIEGKIINQCYNKQFDRDYYWFNYNNIIILADEELMSQLNSYSNSVEELYDSYFISEYNAEMQNSISLVDTNSRSDINCLSGHEFELFCKKLIEKMGFETEITKASGDGGIDIIAFNHQPLLSGKYIIQCKRYSGSVGEPIIRDLYGVVASERANKGILITTGCFTKSAIEFAADKQLELIDGSKLATLMNTYELDFQYNPSYLKKSINQILEDALILDIEDYKDKINSLNSNPCDEITRVKLIQQLMGYVFGIFPEIDVYDDRLVIYAEIKNHIKQYIKYINKSNKKTLYMKSVLKIIYIQLSFLENNYIEAYKTYIELVNQNELCVYSKDRYGINPTLLDNVWLFNCLYSISYDMVQLSLLAYDDNFTDRIFRIGKDIFDVQQGHLSLSSINFDGDLTDSQVSFAKKEYERFEKIKTLNSLYMLDDYIVSQCLEYVYYSAPPFPYVPESYSIIISGSNLILQDNNREYCRISNWKDSIEDAIKKL